MCGADLLGHLPRARSAVLRYGQDGDNLVLARRSVLGRMGENPFRQVHRLGNLLDRSWVLNSLIREDSAWPVGGAPMLDSVHDHDAGSIVDAVDHPVITSTGGEQAAELSDEWLAESAGILPDRSPHGGEGGITDLFWKLVEVAETFRGDPDLVCHSAASSGGRQLEQVAACSFGSRSGEG